MLKKKMSDLEKERLELLKIMEEYMKDQKLPIIKLPSNTNKNNEYYNPNNYKIRTNGTSSTSNYNSIVYAK